MDSDAIRRPGVEFGALPGYLGYQVRQAQSAVFRDFTRITAELGLTPGEFGLLTMVRQNPGVSQVALAGLYKLDKSTLSISVKGLTGRGLIRRLRGEHDRRYFSLWLTPEGAAVLERVTGRVEEQERMMDAVLAPGERERLLDMLSRIARAFD